LLYALAAPKSLRKRKNSRCGAASFPAIRLQRSEDQTPISQDADFAAIHLLLANARRQPMLLKNSLFLAVHPGLLT
jgi:hypothetical protein